MLGLRKKTHDGLCDFASWSGKGNRFIFSLIYVGVSPLSEHVGLVSVEFDVESGRLERGGKLDLSHFPGEMT